MGKELVLGIPIPKDVPQDLRHVYVDGLESGAKHQKCPNTYLPLLKQLKSALLVAKNPATRKKLEDQLAKVQLHRDVYVQGFRDGNNSKILLKGGLNS